MGGERVCVCERERERERKRSLKVLTHVLPHPHIAINVWQKVGGAGTGLLTIFISTHDGKQTVN